MLENCKHVRTLQDGTSLYWAANEATFSSVDATQSTYAACAWGTSIISG